MTPTQCEMCLNFDYDPELDEDYCTMHMDQDDLEKLRANPRSGCPYFRLGDDYTIMRKQGF